LNISLRPVTRENYETITELDVSKEQESYVADNTWTLLEAAYNSDYVTRAIYCNEKAAGLFMWVPEKENCISIWRFMVDQKLQQQGIGRAALRLALKEIRQTPGIKQIDICYDPENPVAKDFYASFGFIETGLDEDGEDMLAVIEVTHR
jgi:diamine N-acetyltransferase